MIVDTPVLSDSVIGTARVQPEVGDNAPNISQTLSIVIPSLLKAVVGVPTGAITADSSVFASFAEHKLASQAITVATLISLPPGSYTIDASVSARFITTPPATDGAPEVRIDLINEALTTGAIIVGVHGVGSNAYNANRRMDIIVVEPSLIRRISNATIAAQTITHYFSVSVERHL